VHSILGSRSNIYLLGPGDLLLYAMRPLAETRRELVFGSPWLDPEGGPRSEGEDRWEGLRDEPYLIAIEMTYAGLESEEQAQILGRRLEQAIRKEMDYLDRKAANLEQDLGTAAHAESLRHQGELLKSALDRIRPGDEAVAVDDFSSGLPIVIALDARLSPAENLAAYFRRYQKVRRSAGALQQQLERVWRAQQELDTLQDRLRAIASDSGARLAGLKELAMEPSARRLLRRHAPEPAIRASRPAPPSHRSKEIPARLQPKRYRTEQGLEIWVGRNDEGNDYLTTRLARGQDLFFHLEGYPGSHVVLRTEGRRDPPAASVLDACELAVHFSRLRDARQADVHVAAVKDVRKPRGSKPGLVMVAGGKTVHLRRDPRRLENILATRMDE